MIIPGLPRNVKSLFVKRKFSIITWVKLLFFNWGQAHSVHCLRVVGGGAIKMINAHEDTFGPRKTETAWNVISDISVSQCIIIS